MWIEYRMVRHAGRYRGFAAKYEGPTAPFSQFPSLKLVRKGWLGSRVVSVLDSGAEGPGSNGSRDAVG